MRNKTKGNLDELIDHLEYLSDLTKELQEGLDDLEEMEIEIDTEFELDYEGGEDIGE